MLNRLLSSTSSLTGRLAMFFAGISCVIGLVTYCIFQFALEWSEDRVGERRMLIDRDSAILHFLSGAEGKIRLDALTTAYNDMSLVPEHYHSFLEQHDTFLDEVDPPIQDTGYMLYKGHYIDKGERKTIVLLSLVDKVELDNEEFLYSGLIVIGFITVLMTILGTLLYRLSNRLIEPVNDIFAQLNASAGDTSKPFTISRQASEEFHTLVSSLNHYRIELDQAFKREQAFARYASHELRTPLTVVKGANSLLKRKEHSPFQARQIARISDASNQMSTMVDALLSIVRYERGIDDASLRSLEQNEVESIIATNGVDASAKEIAVELNFVDAPQIKATPAVMHMVLGNLIRNSIAASDGGTISVTVDSNAIEVIDDGKGLTVDKDKDGHGLGLMIVTDLCRRYDWRFSLGNHPTRGCHAQIKISHS